MIRKVHSAQCTVHRMWHSVFLCQAQDSRELGAWSYQAVSPDGDVFYKIRPEAATNSAFLWRQSSSGWLSVAPEGSDDGTPKAHIKMSRSDTAKI